MRAPRAARAGRLARQVLAAGCGLVWWWAALRLAVVPGARLGPGEGAVLAGWSLGLIPLHAVPARPRIRRGGALPRLRRPGTGRRGRAAPARDGTSGPAAGQAPDQPAEGTGPR